jgi:uncharacterized membrane protein (UPF0136 family)
MRKKRRATPANAISHPATDAHALAKITMSGLDTTSYVMAVLTAGGGIAGFARTGSLPSLIAGCSVGLLYGFGGHQIQSADPNGPAWSLLASVVLGGSSIPRALRLRKPVPIALSVLSTVGLVVFGDAYRKAF